MIKKDILSDSPDSLSEFKPAISFSPLSMLLIAPYPGLKLLFEEVCSQYTSLILDAYISDTEDAASFIQSLPLEHYDLIISIIYWMLAFPSMMYFVRSGLPRIITESLLS